MALHRLVFDTTDSSTIADSANVGAYLRSDDGTLLTHTTDGSREALDVFTELGHAEDSAHTSGDIGAMALAVRNDTEGSLAGTDGDYAPLQVDSVGRLRVVADLDVTNLSEKAEDDAHVSADIGDYVLAVRADTRPTDANTSADGDYASFFVNTNGELYVKATDTDALLTTIDADTSNISTNSDTIATDTGTIATNTGTTATNTGTIATNTGTTATNTTTIAGAIQVEDDAHSSGDTGIMGLAVRNDTLAALAGTDGDYAPLQVNASGALYTAIDGDVSINDAALANTAIATAANAMTAANTAEDIIASPLADRKYLFVYNNGNKVAYIGASGVSAATGFPLFPGSILEMRAGAAIDIEWVAADTNQEIRTLEVS